MNIKIPVSTFRKSTWYLVRDGAVVQGVPDKDGMICYENVLSGDLLVQRVCLDGISSVYKCQVVVDRRGLVHQGTLEEDEFRKIFDGDLPAGVAENICSQDRAERRAEVPVSTVSADSVLADLEAALASYVGRKGEGSE